MSNKSLLAPALLLAFSATAQATPFSAQEVLEQVNLGVGGNLTTTSHVDGRTYVGNDLTVNGAVFAMHSDALPTSQYTGLTVGGNVSGSGAYVNSGAGAEIGGSGSDLIHLNGGGTLLTTVSAANPMTVMSALSDSLKGLADTGGTVTIDGNKATFSAIANAQGLAVFDLTANDTAIFNLGEFAFNLNGAQTVVINTDNTHYNIAANFLGGSAQAIADNVIWNFYNAEIIDIRAQFGGVVLATNADLDNHYSNIEGGVFVDNFNQSGEVHYAGFTGNVASVPEADTCALLLIGLGVMTLLARRRRSA